MGDDVKSRADKTAREQLERNDEVAASAAPQGDGVPDNAGPSETPGAESGGDDEDSDGMLSGTGEYEEIEEVEQQDSWLVYVIAEK